MNLIEGNQSHVFAWVCFGYWTALNSSRPSDAIWRHKSGSTLAQVMACCLTAPSHYLNQCRLIISTVLWHSSKGNFTRDNSAINHWNYLENEVPKISFKFPRGQWVNKLRPTKWPPLCKQYFENYFLGKKIYISIKISLKFVPKGPIDIESALVQAVAFCLAGNKLLPELMSTRCLDTICSTL